MVICKALWRTGSLLLVASESCFLGLGELTLSKHPACTQQNKNPQQQLGAGGENAVAVSEAADDK